MRGRGHGRGSFGDWGRDWMNFGPWGHWGRFFSAGELRLALLSLLEERPKHGYELMKNLEARSGGAYRASAGSIYPTLQQLEDEGLVACESAGGKRVYRLAPEGTAELKREAQTVQRIWKRADGVGGWAECMGPEIGTIACPVARLLKSAFRAVSEDPYDHGRITKIQGILDRAAEEVEGLRRAASEV